MQENPQNNEHIDAEVAFRAYELWEKAGQPLDRDLEFWFSAERELRFSGQEDAPAAWEHLPRPFGVTDGGEEE